MAVQRCFIPPTAYQTQVVAFFRRADVVDVINGRYQRGVRPQFRNIIEEVRLLGVPALERIQVSGSIAAYELALVLRWGSTCTYHRIFCGWKTFANEPNQQKNWIYSIAGIFWGYNLSWNPVKEVFDFSRNSTDNKFVGSNVCGTINYLVNAQFVWGRYCEDTADCSEHNNYPSRRRWVHLDYSARTPDKMLWIN